jgi:cytochrome b subunit of formate dehydrogenase
LAIVPQPSVYQRFSLTQRLEHVLAIGSFTLLAVTGLPQMFAAHGWAQAMIGFFGGIEVTRDLHHFAAIVLMLEVAWHLVSLGYHFFVRRARPTMLPGARDVTDAWGTFLYNVGLRKQRPLSGRYSFEEKVEYWAFVWGTVIMAITGFMMWNPIATARLLPGEFIPAAKAAHGNEALLAVLAIIVWHLYSVHIRHFNRSMWTGNLTASEMSDEHPLELADIQAGRAQLQLDPLRLKKRQRIYGPVAGVLALVFVFGIYEFATFETTVIDTVPLRVVEAAQVQAFVPLTPTPLPVPQLSPVPAGLKPIWDGNIELVLANNCGTCHGGIAGLDFSSYASTLSGGQNGLTVLPGDPDHSPLLQRIKDGTHPGKLIAAQLSKLKAWISAGAPEQ